MVHVDEQYMPDARHGLHTSGGSHVLEPLALAVVEQVAAAVRPDRKQVEPAVVVVVGEGRRDGARGQRQRRPAADVGYVTAVDGVEPRERCDDQEIVLTVAVVIAQRQRSRPSAEVRQAAFARDIGEPHAGVDTRGWRDAPHRDERLRAELQYGPARQRAFDPVDLGERRLIGRRGLDQAQQPLERGARLRQSTGAQRLQRCVELRLCLARRLGTRRAHVLEVADRAVRPAEREECGGELEPHGEIRRRPLEDLPETLRIAICSAVAALMLELRQRVEDTRVRWNRCQHLAGFRGASGERIQFGGYERDFGAGGVEPPRALR